MGMIFNVTGGGGSSLNFKVVGTATTPTNPAENTIWVKTSTAIASWCFSAEEPAAATAGMVWITTGTGGLTSFNALKKNALWVYPMSAQQYVSGKWVLTDASIYQDNQWTDLSSTLYFIKDGVKLYDFKTRTDTTTTGSKLNITQGDGYVSVAGSSDGYHFMFTSDIDLTKYKTLSIAGTLSVAYYNYLYVWPASTDPSSTNSVASAKIVADRTVLDVTGLSGKHRVGIVLGGIYSHKITDFMLEA